MPAQTPLPEEVLEVLKQNATERTRKSLDIIHAICREQAAKGSPDFSVVTIGRLSTERGGPSTQPIRNKSGEHYRSLIAAWATSVNGATRKPPARAEPAIAEDILEMIRDPSVRAVVGVIIAENRKLKAENILLKGQTQIVIDQRKLAASTTPGPPSQHVDTLLPIEIEALDYAISDNFLKQMGWEINANSGRVMHGQRSITRPGYITAIKKILDAYQGR